MRSFLILLVVLMAGSTASLAADHGVILAYHHVADDTPPSTSISPAQFRRHLEYLRDNGFTVIGLDTLISSLRDGRQLPDRAVVISFDDGYISIYEQAFPMLQAFDYPFSLFLSTEPIDSGQRNYMSWQQIREMSDAGVVIGNHMIDHPYMLEGKQGESNQQRLQRLRQELLQAEQTILKETGQSHRYLAYPYGEYDRPIKAMLSELGFVGLAQNSGAVSSHSDFQALPRFPLGSIYANLDTARVKFEALAFDVEQVEPLSPVTGDRSPDVTLKFAPGNYNRAQLGCFANSKPIPMNWLDMDMGLVELLPTEAYRGRRWRYICTAPDLDSRRFYWYSVQWINTGD
jgi:peptidoglycan/xylan/chitin deacetylase (PgdA/CDA1 family)